MTSERASSLIAAFRSAQTHGEESAEKIELLRQLDGLAESEVTRFLADVAGDPMEYDLARIEAIRMLEVGRIIVDEERLWVAGGMQRVLREDEDDQVRAYAARCLASFTDISGIVAFAGELVLDTNEDDDVRHNAFLALERSPANEEALDILTNCLTDDEFKEAATRVLAKWHELPT